MARPSLLTPQAVVKALTFTPVAPSALANELGVSRATLHRKLKALEEEGLVTKIGQGPAAAYRRWLAEDMPSPQAGSDLLRWTLPESSVFYVLEALDLYTRLGIGQLEQLEETLRLSSFDLGEDRDETFNALDKIKHLCDVLKLDVLDFSRGASFGVHHPSVDPGVSRVWYLLKVLRHRLSWDRHPEGSIGVGHDEPMFNDMGAVVRVHSVKASSLDERAYVVDMDLHTALSAAHACQASHWARSRQFTALVALFETGVIKPRNLIVPSVVDIAHAQTLLAEIEKLASCIGLSEKQAQKAQALKQIAIQLQEVIQAPDPVENGMPPAASSALEALSGSSFVRLGRAPEPLPSALVEGLPSSFALGWRNNECWVLDLDAGCYIGRSHSVQTAVQLATNRLNARPS